MKRVLTFSLLLGKRILKNPLFIILLAAIPLSVLFLRFLPQEIKTASYEVGIYTGGTDPLAEELVDAVCAEDLSFHFTRYDDPEEMTHDVINNTLVSGYVLPSDLTMRTENGDLIDAIVVITTPGNILSTAISEIVYADLIRIQGRTYVADYVENAGVFATVDADLLEELYAIYDSYLDSEHTFRVIYETYKDGQYEIYASDGAGATEETMTFSFPLRGMLSLLIALAGLLGGVTFMLDREKGVFAAFFRRDLLLCGGIYIVVPAALFGLCSLVTLGLAGEFTIWWKEIGALLVYLCCILLYTAGLIALARKSRNLIAGIPLLLLGSLLLCPIFINAASYFPPLSVVNKLFLPTYYLLFFF